jgi:CubicO group peptidase (beta-lactamase class C family)
MDQAPNVLELEAAMSFLRATGHPAFAALGYGGQVVAVIPALRLVTVIQSTNPPSIANGPPRGAGEGDYLSMVCTLIAPAVAH